MSPGTLPIARIPDGELRTDSFVLGPRRCVLWSPTEYYGVPLAQDIVARRCRPSQAIRGWPNDGMACLDSRSAVWACLILLAKSSALNVVGGCAGLPTAKGVKDRSLSIRYKLFGVGQQLRKDPETSYGVLR